MPETASWFSEVSSALICFVRTIFFELSQVKTYPAVYKPSIESKLIGIEQESSSVRNIPSGIITAGGFGSCGKGSGSCRVGINCFQVIARVDEYPVGINIKEIIGSHCQ